MKFLKEHAFAISTTVVLMLVFLFITAMFLVFTFQTKM